MAQLPPFAIAETTPADNDFIRIYPTAERLFRDIVESWLNIHSDAATGYAKMPVGTTAALAALSPAPGLGATRYDTTTNTFHVNTNGSLWNIISLQPGVGLVMRTFDGNAPPGWTKSVLGASNFAIVVGDAGATLDLGGANFSTVFAARTIAQANLPNVNFTVSGTAASAGAHSHGGVTGGESAQHTHAISLTTDLQGLHSHVSFSNVDVSSGGVDIDSNTAPARELSSSGDASYTMQRDAGNTPAQVGRSSTDGGHQHNISGNTGNNSVGHTHSISSDGAHTHSVSGNAASGGSGTALDFSVARLGYIAAFKSNPA